MTHTVQTPPYVYLILQARFFYNRKDMSRKKKPGFCDINTSVPPFRRGGKKNKDDTMGRVLNDRALFVMEHHGPKAEAAFFFFFRLLSQN